MSILIFKNRNVICYLFSLIFELIIPLKTQHFVTLIKCHTMWKSFAWNQEFVDYVTILTHYVSLTKHLMNVVTFVVTLEWCTSVFTPSGPWNTPNMAERSAKTESGIRPSAYLRSMMICSSYHVRLKEQVPVATQCRRHICLLDLFGNLITNIVSCSEEYRMLTLVLD